MDLRNLGRFLGLLTSAGNQSGFDNRLDIISLLREAVAKGNNALRCIIPFVCQFLTGGDGVTRKNFRIFKLLKLIHDKITEVTEIKSEVRCILFNSFCSFRLNSYLKPVKSTCLIFQWQNTWK